MKIGYLMQAGAPEVRAQPLSGPAAHVWNVCRELQGLGHSVRLLMLAGGSLWRSDDLVSFAPVATPLDRGARRLFERGVRRVQSQSGLPYLHLFESLRFAAACRQELGDCDILYERMGWMGYGGAIAARRSGQPLILEVNGDHLTEYEMLNVAPKGVQRAASIRIMRWATRQAAHVVATGAGWRRRFLERWGGDPQRVSVIENGSEVVSLLAREQLAVFATAGNDGPGNAQAPVQMVYVGAFEPWHGITVLLAALEQALAQGTQVHLHLIGDGSELPVVQQKLVEHNLAAHVTLHGFLRIQQAAPILRTCEIGVSPYCGRVEYSGLKLLDYKAAGLATIASGQNGEPGVLRQGVTGWITPPCDVEQLAAAITTLCWDAGLRRRIGQTARLEAEQQHSWRCTAQQLEAVFLQVVQS
jgi:glycosyltransferase involved in cell wall biosynthesis